MLERHEDVKTQLSYCGYIEVFFTTTTTATNNDVERKGCGDQFQAI